MRGWPFSKTMTELFILAGLLILLVLAFRWFERANLYFPDKEMGATPAQLKIPFEEVHFPSVDGTQLNGWHIPVEKSSGAAPTLLFFHGNAGNISHRLQKIWIFNELGANVFIFDYRGYGKSAGRPSERGLYQDGEAAFAYLTDKIGVPPRNVVFYGESLGTAVATDLATRHQAHALILESPFTSTKAMGKRLFPYLPVSLLVSQEFDTLAKIPRIKPPLLILHSPEDEIIPYAMAEDLFEAAPEPKALYPLKGGHNDGFQASGEAYSGFIGRFLGLKP